MSSDRICFIPFNVRIRFVEWCLGEKRERERERERERDRQILRETERQTDRERERGRLKNNKYKL